jgi:hypothetical protein
MFSERRGNKRRHTDYTLTIMGSSTRGVRGVSSDVLEIRLPLIKFSGMVVDQVVDVSQETSASRLRLYG